MDDTQIIALLTSHDERGLQAIREQYGKRLHTAAMRHVHTDEDADEVVSDVLMQVWQAIPPAKPENLFAFLSGLTKRTAINRWQHDTAAKRGGGERPAVLEELSECLPAPDHVEQQTELHALTEALNRFLRALPAEPRRIMILRYVQERSVREIAEHCGISEAKVKTSLFRSRKKLHDFLEKEDWL